jgi:plasmid stability protein
MPNVQIRNVPDDVHRLFKERAAYAGQSLNEYLLSQLKEIASRPTIAELTERIREHEPYEGPSVAAIIREERERR